MPRMDQEPGRKRRLAWRRVLWAGLLAVVLAGVLVAGRLFSGTDAFKVDGLPFREWVASRPDFQIQEPLAKLGSNAVPHLVRVLHREPESPPVFQWRQSLWNHLPRLLQARFPHLRPIPDGPVRRTALFGLRFLGLEAQAALPDIVRIARTETNRMVRSSALLAALNVAPQAPETFELWRAEWERTNSFSHHDLAIYLHMPRVASKPSARQKTKFLCAAFNLGHACR